MLEWLGNGIPESWAEAWPQMFRAQQLVVVLRADFSPGNSQLWALVSNTLGAAWKQTASVVNEQVNAWAEAAGSRRSGLSWSLVFN